MNEQDPKWEISISFLDKNQATIKRTCHQMKQQPDCVELIYLERWDKGNVPHMKFEIYPMATIRKIVAVELDRPLIETGKPIIEMSKAIQH